MVKRWSDKKLSTDQHFGGDLMWKGGVDQHFDQRFWLGI